MEYGLFVELEIFSIIVQAIYLMEENTCDFAIKKYFCLLVSVIATGFVETVNSLTIPQILFSFFSPISSSVGVVM